MDTGHEKVNLLGMGSEALRQWVTEQGEKPFRAQQLMKWMFHRLEADFSAMTDISKAFRARLAEVAEIQPPEVLLEKDSADGTRKWVMAMPGGSAIETVFIPDGKRGTLCISSQIGCGLNCTFCSTARQGFNRNLTTAEIIGQVWVAARSLGQTPEQRRITNVVFMGMGEPLLNFDNVMQAVSLMRDDFGFGLAGKRITLSTAGMVPMIDRMREVTDISLAVSLHAPNDALRDQLVPLNKRYPIAELMAACKRYVAGRRGDRVTMEYTLIEGVNDQPEHARELIRLLVNVPSKINLIPFNPFPGSNFKRPGQESIRRFQKLLLDHDKVATLRKTRGDDIDAACGQLVGQVADRTRRSQRLNPAIPIRG